MEQEPYSCGDGRLDRANGCIHDRLPSHGCDGISLRRLGGNRAGEIRMGRLVRNKKLLDVTMNEDQQRTREGSRKHGHNATNGHNIVSGNH